MYDRKAELMKPLKDGKKVKKKVKKVKEVTPEISAEDDEEDGEPKRSRQGQEREMKQTINPAFNQWIVKINQCYEELDIINDRSDGIDSYSKKMASVTSSEKEKILVTKVEAICEDNKTSLRAVDDVVKQLQQELQTNKHGFDEHDQSVLLTQYQTMIEKYKDSVNNFIKKQRNFKESNESKMKRQLDILDPSLTEREKDRMLADPVQVQELINRKVSGRATVKLTSAVKDIQDKYNDILQLEANIKQLLELLTEINDLIHDSGQIVDQIKSNFSAAKILTDKGNKDLDEAKDELKKAKGKQWWMCICAFGAMCVIGAPIILTILVNTKIF